MKTLLSLFILAVSLTAQTTINIGIITVPNEVSVAVETYRMNQGLQTGTLVGGINASVTSLTVTSPAPISVGDQIVIDTEAMNVTAKAGSVLTVTRAASITVAAAHANNAIIKRVPIPTAIAFMKALLLEIVQQKILRSQPSTTIATERAKIVAAEAAIEAFNATVVQ